MPHLSRTESLQTEETLLLLYRTRNGPGMQVYWSHGAWTGHFPTFDESFFVVRCSFFVKVAAFGRSIYGLPCTWHDSDSAEGIGDWESGIRGGGALRAQILYVGLWPSTGMTYFIFHFE
jgi:hypothetical protein